MTRQPNDGLCLKMNQHNILMPKNEATQHMTRQLESEPTQYMMRLLDDGLCLKVNQHNI